MLNKLEVNSISFFKPISGCFDTSLRNCHCCIERYITKDKKKNVPSLKKRNSHNQT